MAQDKYKAIWVSHSSISDFLQCPLAYFLGHIYKDRITGHKLSLIKPPLALGQTVHAVIEYLSFLPVENRFQTPLYKIFEQKWEKISGDKGGFRDREEEEKYKERGKRMIKLLEGNPGPLANLAVKIKKELPYFWLSKEENLILCGKIDWLEYLPETKSVHIIDFKTGRYEEDKDSLQLPIYFLLADRCQHRKVTKASYWYLIHSTAPVEQQLPSANNACQQVLKIARKIKKAREEKNFSCPRKYGCYLCRPLEAIVAGKGRLVGIDEFRRDVYILKSIEA